MDHLSLIASGGAGLSVLTAGAPPREMLVLGIGTDEAHAARVRKERGLSVHVSSSGELAGWEHLEPSVASHFITTMPAGVRGAFTRKVVLHVTGLGGRTGTSVAKALCRIRSGLSKPTLHLAILPFSVERQRHSRALEDAVEMGAMSTVVHFPNDLVARASPDRPFQESIHVANLLVLEVVRGLASLPGEAIGMIARSKGGYLPVLGVGPGFSREVLLDFGAAGGEAGHLIGSQGSALLTGLRDKMAEAGISVTPHESTGVAADHWLMLIRPASGPV